MFGPGMHPNSFVLVCMFECSVNNTHVVVGIFAQKHQDIVIQFSQALLPKNSIPVVTVYSLSNVKINQNDMFVTDGGCSNNLVQVFVESFLVFVQACKSCCVGADNGDIPGLVERKVEFHNAFLYSSRQRCSLAEQFSLQNLLRESCCQSVVSFSPKNVSLLTTSCNEPSILRLVSLSALSML